MRNYLREHWQYLTSPGRYPGIDLLRAIAVSMVVLYHFFPFASLGWTGVDLFFVISGFLIGGSILEQAWDRRFSFRQFYSRRALRILPTYYFVLAVGALLKQHDSASAGTTIATLISSVLFLHTLGPYFLPQVFRLDPSFQAEGSWSLVVEEVFYLIAPAALLLFIWIARRRRLVVAGLLTLVMLTGVVVRLLMTRGFAPDDADWHFASFVQFHSRYDELVAGVLAACLVRTGFEFRRYVPWLLAGATGLVALFVGWAYSNPTYLTQPWLITRATIWLPSLFAVTGLLLVLALHRLPVRWQPIVVLARISYPLYLTHLLLLVLTNQADEQGFVGWLGRTFGTDGRDVIYIGCALVIAYLVSLLVEYPFLRLYKKPPGSTDSQSERSRDDTAPAHLQKEVPDRNWPAPERS